MSTEDMPRTKGVERWEAEEALRILVKAEQIEADTKTMSAVANVAKENAEAADRVAQKFDVAPTHSVRHPDRDRANRVDM